MIAADTSVMLLSFFSSYISMTRQEILTQFGKIVIDFFEQTSKEIDAAPPLYRDMLVDTMISVVSRFTRTRLTRSEIGEFPRVFRQCGLEMRQHAGGGKAAYRAARLTQKLLDIIDSDPS